MPTDELSFVDDVLDHGQVCFAFNGEDGQEVGRLQWADGILRFTGNADESAKRLFELVAGILPPTKALE